MTRDEPLLALIEPAAVAREGPHALFGAGFQDGSDLEEFAAADVGFDRVGGKQEFALGNADLKIGTVQETLGENGDKTIGKLRRDGALDFGRERSNDALEGFNAGGGMDGGHDEMAGFGGVEGESHGFGLPHFANHQDIGIFSEGVEEGLFEAWCVAPHLALSDVGALGAERVFDGALDGQDMPGFGGVDLLEQGGQRGGLAAAGRAADQDESVRVGDEFPEVGMEIEFLKSGLERGQEPDG